MFALERHEGLLLLLQDRAKALRFQRQACRFLFGCRLPLDSRSAIGKTDWTMWAAAMAKPGQLASFAAPLAAYLRETPSRVPFSDYYDTETGTYEKFMARTVQGGIFMPLLMRRWSGR